MSKPNNFFSMFCQEVGFFFTFYINNIGNLPGYNIDYVLQNKMLFGGLQD